MELILKDIVVITGRPGLFKIVRPLRNGIIIESIDTQRQRSIKTTNLMNVLSLESIGIYTADETGTMPLSNVFVSMYTQFQDNLGVSVQDTPDALHAWMASVVPQYNKQKVDASKIAKIISWYQILRKYMASLFTDQPADVAQMDAPVQETQA